VVGNDSLKRRTELLQMKNRIPTLGSILGASMLVAGMAAAQTQPPPMQQQTPPAQTQPAQTPPATTSPTQSTSNADVNNASANTGSNGGDSATYNTAQGQVTINSTMGQAPSTAAPPSFEQLANGKKFISKEDANSYPPLANEFEYVAHNGNRISKAQYDRWVKNSH
jgi:hypothetical protein